MLDICPAVFVKALLVVAFKDEQSSKTWLFQAEEKPADPKTGRYLMDLVNSVPKIEPEQFEEMLNSNMKVCTASLYM